MSRIITLTDLPTEIICSILEYTIFKPSDFRIICLTCKRLNEIVNGVNSVCRRMCLQRWSWMNFYIDDLFKSQNQIRDWKKIWQQSIKTVTELKELANKEPSQIKHIYTIPCSFSKLKKIVDMFDTDEDASPFSFDLIRKELMILYPDSEQVFQMYVYSALKFAVETWIIFKWKANMQQPATERIVEKHGLLLLQVLNKTKEAINGNSLSVFLDNLAEKTKEKLMESWPSHPLFSTPIGQFALWRYQVIQDNQWDSESCKKILVTICSTLFKVLCKSSISNRQEYTTNINFTERHLKSYYKSPLYFSIIFEGVARRLGVRCNGAICQPHFFIKWKTTFNSTSDSDTYYVDFFKGGRFLQKTCNPTEGTKIGEHQIMGKKGQFDNYIFAADKIKSFFTREIDFSLLNGNKEIIISLMENLTAIELPGDEEDISVLSRLYLDVKLTLWSLLHSYREATIDKFIENKTETYDILGMFFSEIRELFNCIDEFQSI